MICTGDCKHHNVALKYLRMKLERGGNSESYQLPNTHMIAVAIMAHLDGQGFEFNQH